MKRKSNPNLRRPESPRFAERGRVEPDEYPSELPPEPEPQ
jgi:hypothetical protein